VSDLFESSLRIRSWREDPVKFVWDNFGVTPDAWQVKALRAFASSDQKFSRISMQACAGPGKTALEAWIGLNFISCYGDQYDHPKGAAVSVTYDNLKDNLWPEFAKWMRKSKYIDSMFTWTKERIFSKENPEDWFISARSFSKSANEEEQGRTLSGLHSKYVLALIDESGEIPTSVLKAAEQALSNCKFGKIVQAGNPTSLDGMLFAAAKHLRDQWFVIRITGDPDDPDRSPRISIEWARKQIEQYGREDPWVKSYILGEFPAASFDALLSPDEIYTAMNRNVPEQDFFFSQRRIGVDCARFGDDATVIFPRQGLVASRFVEMRGARTNEIASRVMLAQSRFGAEAIFVDDTGGYGAGVIDSLIQNGLSPIAVQFAGKPDDPRYRNKRAEMWYRMAEWVKRGGALPDDPMLAKELAAARYTFHNGRYALEEKDQIKERLKFSPDRADSLACTFFMEDMPSKSPIDRLVDLARENERTQDWEPEFMR
jgi:hypothetical protein